MHNRFKDRFIHFFQVIWLTVRFFFQNNLGIAASSCTFGFIISIIPILMLVLTGCMGLIKISSPLLIKLSESFAQYGYAIDFNSLFDSFSGKTPLSGINIVLVVFTVWMARRLFLSIVQGMNSVFKTVSKHRPVFNQLITFAGELVLVILCAVVFLASFLTSQIFTLPVFDRVRESFPEVFNVSASHIVNYSLFIVLFLFTIICYRVVSGTKPKLSLCIRNSLFCVAFFFCVVKVISVTVDKTNYSSIYGVLGNIMILLLEMWFFFSFFMFFAQAIYVEQFFKSLIIGELYLLPDHEDIKWRDSVRRALFINPGAIIKRESLFEYCEGEPVYVKGNSVDDIYYVYSGTVREIRNGEEKIYSKGKTFGESEFIMNTARIGEARAVSDCTLIKIPVENFGELIEKNSKAAAKAMSSISDYTARIFDAQVQEATFKI